MILTVVKDHPLRELARGASGRDRRPFSRDKDTTGIVSEGNEELNRLPTMLEPFNLRMMYVNEVQNLS